MNTTIDASFFLQEFNTLSGYLRSFAMKLTKDRFAAEDLYQDTALKAIKNQSKFSSDTNMKAWLLTIMKNSFINDYRKRQRRQQIEEASNNAILLMNQPNKSFNDGERSLRASELLELIDALSDNLKKPFLMMYQGYKYEEISQEMQLPIGTIKSRIFWARKELKDKIEKLELV